MRAELPSGLYFDVLLPLPMTSKDRRSAAAELRKMADVVEDRDEDLIPLTPVLILDVISDLVCEADDDEDND
jgi:hypothetical protein